MANKVVQHLVLDSEILTDLRRMSASQGESMSVIARQALRSFLAKNKVAG